MKKLNKQELNNFKEAVEGLKESIPKEEKENLESKRCLEYMSENYYDENIEKKIAGILEFYIKDLESTLDFNKGQQKTYEEIIEKGAM